MIATVGDGKTMTLVHRVRHLINEHRFRGSDILIVAFNRLAATQFRGRLERCDFAGGILPFERERKQKGMTTFDDFVPRAVELLTHSETLRDRWCGRHQQIIVDEYNRRPRHRQRQCHWPHRQPRQLM